MDLSINTCLHFARWCAPQKFKAYLRDGAQTSLARVAILPLSVRILVVVVPAEPTVRSAPCTPSGLGIPQKWKYFVFHPGVVYQIIRNFGLILYARQFDNIIQYPHFARSGQHNEASKIRWGQTEYSVSDLLQRMLTIPSTNKALQKAAICEPFCLHSDLRNETCEFGS